MSINFGSRAGTFFDKVKYFIIFYLVLLLLIIPLLLLMVWRFLISVVLTVVYKGKYKLVSCDRSMFCIDNYANMFNISFFMYINGPFDIKLLRRRIQHTFTTFRGRDGCRPYEVMLCGLEEKFGFLCWKNNGDSFDINQHVGFFPGCSDPDQVYSEEDVLESAAKLADELWDSNKPKWEFLVVPKMKKSDTGEICSVVHARFQHGWVDGISAAQILRLCVLDKPHPTFIVDPVNPPGGRMSFWITFLAYVKAFFVGPWQLLKHGGRKENHVFYEGPLKGGKFFGRTTMDIPLESIRSIRRYYGVSTTAIQHYAFSGAMREMALKKGFPVPDEILGGLVITKMPYSHEYPTIRSGIISEIFPVCSEMKPLDRLHAINKACEITTYRKSYFAILMIRMLFNRILGIFPVFVLKAVFSSLKVSYGISNVPGIGEVAYFNGNKVESIFGMGPLINGNRYFAGVGCYEGKFIFGMSFEKSNLIKCGEDVKEFIQYFENGLKYLMDSATMHSV